MRALLVSVTLVHLAGWAILGWLAPIPVAACFATSVLAFRLRQPHAALVAASAAPPLALLALFAAAAALPSVQPDTGVVLGIGALPASAGVLWSLVWALRSASSPQGYAQVPGPAGLDIEVAHDARAEWTGQRPTIGLALLCHAPVAAAALLAQLRAGGPPGWSRRALAVDAWIWRVERAEFAFGPWNPLWYAGQGARTATRDLGARDRAARAARGDALAPLPSGALEAQEAAAILFIRQVWAAIDLARADADPPNLYALEPGARIFDTPTSDDLARAMGRAPAGGVAQADLGPTPPELEAAARIHTARVIDQSLAPERLMQMALGPRELTPPAP